MLDANSAQTIFAIIIGLFTVGAFGSLFLGKNDNLARIWSSIFSVLGSLLGVVFALYLLMSNLTPAFNLTATTFPVLNITFRLDRLSQFFIFVISIIALFCSIYGIDYVKHYFKKYNIGSLGFFYNLFIAGMILVVTASNGILFLIVWEIMSLASYFLVVYDKNDENNIKAGFRYLVMTHIGTAFIIGAFTLLFKFTGSFDFNQIKANLSSLPMEVKNLIFIFSLIGFGTKAGIIPFHIWLPSAHPAAPSHVSALMSGVMIKTGIYMMIRMFLDILQPIPVWWGVVVLVIGAVSALLGVLYALTEHDLKKLLAYHSIENIGIILLGLGSALVFSAWGMPALALLGIVAALFHTLNHATFKSLLFLSAGSVINQTHTRNMEEYGGLLKVMPFTGLFFLIGAMAISALPPFNGFASEWLTFQSLFQAFKSVDPLVGWVFILAAGSLAFTGGLALACFVKAFGVSFLARPRTHEAKEAKESPLSMQIGMGALAALCLVFGLSASYLVIFLEKIATDLEFFKNNPTSASLAFGQTLTVNNNFASISPITFFLVFVIIFAIVVLVVKFIINRQQKQIIAETWDCGVDLNERMEITATGFSRSIIIIFKRILRPVSNPQVEYHDAEKKYLPKTKEINLTVQDVYHTYMYQPLRDLAVRLSNFTRRIQTGNINSYILYIFLALVIAIFIIL